jgi:hypothetical protein
MPESGLRCGTDGLGFLNVDRVPGTPRDRRLRLDRLDKARGKEGHIVSAEGVVRGGPVDRAGAGRKWPYCVR